MEEQQQQQREQQDTAKLQHDGSRYIVKAANLRLLSNNFSSNKSSSKRMRLHDETVWNLSKFNQCDVIKAIRCAEFIDVDKDATTNKEVLKNHIVEDLKSDNNDEDELYTTS